MSPEKWRLLTVIVRVKSSEGADLLSSTRNERYVCQRFGWLEELRLIACTRDDMPAREMCSTILNIKDAEELR